MVMDKITRVLSKLKIRKEKQPKNTFSDVHKEIVIDTRYPIERVHHQPIKVSAPVTIEPSSTKEVLLQKVTQKKSKAKIKLPKIRLKKSKKR